VPITNIRAGSPDRGNLLIYRSTPEGVEKVAQIDLTDPNVSSWEDARAYCSDEPSVDNAGIENHTVLIGLTAIRAFDNKPVAAMVRGKVINGNLLIDLESLVVYLTDEGKNVTPIALSQSLFRREVILGQKFRNFFLKCVLFFKIMIAWTARANIFLC
jgi:hypothetical protein